MYMLMMKMIRNDVLIVTALYNDAHMPLIIDCIHSGLLVSCTLEVLIN